MQHVDRAALGTTVAAGRRTAAMAHRGRLVRSPAGCWRRCCPGPGPDRPDAAGRIRWPAAVPIPARCGCARSGARRAASAHRGRRSCRDARCSPGQAVHSRSQQWSVRFPPAVLHTHAPHTPTHQVPVTPYDPACHSGSVAGDPTAHKRLGPCNPATHPLASCAKFLRPDVRRSHPLHRPNTPPVAYRCLSPHPVPPPRTRAPPHARSDALRSRPVRCGNRGS